MKKLLPFLFLFVFNFYVQAQPWISQATGFSTVSVGVRNVIALDANVVWISTYDGSGGNAAMTDFSRTTDGGATWIPGTVSVPVGYSWSMIAAADAMTAWGMFYNKTANAGGGIWKTTDGGVTWNQQSAGSIFNATSFPDVIYFWNANEGVAIGDPNPATAFEIYTTTDGGTTWTPRTAPAPLANEFGIVNHYAVFGNNIWFDTDNGRVYHSTDKGVTWTVAATGITVPANQVIDIVFYTATNGIARLYDNTNGGNTIIKRTFDGGATWGTATVTGRFLGADVKYISGTDSSLVSTGDILLPGFLGSSYSLNGGITWTDFTNDTIVQRTALGVVNPSTMWAGGFSTDSISDGIFKFTSFVSVNEAQSNEAFSQFYPNPAIEKTILNFDTGNIRNATLQLYNITGKLVYSNVVNAAKGKVEIDVRNFDAGVYLCKLTAGATHVNQKLIVVK